MTITITDPKLIETLERVREMTQFVRADGTVILTVEPQPITRRLVDLSPFTEEELARRREEWRKNPVGRSWKEIRKDLDAME